MLNRNDGSEDVITVMNIMMMMLKMMKYPTFTQMNMGGYQRPQVHVYMEGLYDSFDHLL